MGGGGLHQNNNTNTCLETQIQEANASVVRTISKNMQDNTYRELMSFNAYRMDDSSDEGDLIDYYTEQYYFMDIDS